MKPARSTLQPGAHLARRATLGFLHAKGALLVFGRKALARRPHQDLFAGRPPGAASKEVPLLGGDCVMLVSSRPTVSIRWLVSSPYLTQRERDGSIDVWEVRMRSRANVQRVMAKAVKRRSATLSHVTLNRLPGRRIP
jgi:hypothetical protein